MPYYALIGHDAPGSLELRKRHRDAHIANLRALDEAGRVRHAGPLLDDSGAPLANITVTVSTSGEDVTTSATADDGSLLLFLSDENIPTITGVRNTMNIGLKC